MEPESRATDELRTPRAEETRERILNAAEAVFSERGFDAATTREIAALAGTNVATPYSYFAGKEALYTAVLERAIGPLIELMDHFAREVDKPGASTAVIQAVLQRLASHQGTTRLMYREVVANGPLAELLTQTLFEPLIDRVCKELRAGGHVAPAMQPFIASLFVHLSFSHVALAPLLSQIFDVDMLSPESLARQAGVIRAASAQAVSGFADEG